MITTNIQSSDIKHFVQEQLGCGCPDEVFSDIQVIHNPDLFEGLPVDYLVEIGGRLLVAVSKRNWRELLESLERVYNIGIIYRDSHGYNRFRLVVATTDNNAQASMQLKFNSMVIEDEKIHIHVIDRALLPKLINAAIKQAHA